jgi:nicotinamide-nucleotide amidase
LNCRRIDSNTKEVETVDIPRQAVSFLTSRSLKLATAESCTAGYIASLISSVPGSGSCLDVGFVTYSPTGKSGFLGVREETMKRYGLTSEEVAREMSEGALNQEACCADVAVSNTGVADAAPGDGPPPGTQCFAWSYKVRGGEIVTFSETKAFDGERNEVRRAAALYALSRIEHHFNRLPRHRAKRNGGEHD